ncbi:MAG: hypothetical protein AB9869_34710 [Verrucomicrobiia bacterium]
MRFRKIGAMKSMACLLGCLSLVQVAWGQGQFYFNNRIGTEVDARFINPCTDPFGDSSIGSPDWIVQLFGGPQGTPVANLLPLDPPSTTFRGAAGTPQAGYVVGVTVTVPSVAAGATADVLVRVLGPGGITLDAGPYYVTLGGDLIVPPNLQLGTMPPFICPEPATGLLALLGGFAALVSSGRHPMSWLKSRQSA